MEKVDEFQAAGGTFDFGARMYNNRLGRWLSRDPQESRYISLSPYCFAGNGPTYAIDPNGEEIIIIGSRSFRNKVARHLKKLAQQSSTARKLIEELISSPDPLIIQESVGKSETNHIWQSYGTGTYYKGAQILFDADLEFNSETDGEDGSFIQNPNELVLFHEMVHAHDIMHGVQNYNYEDPDTDLATWDGDWGAFRYSHIDSYEVKAVNLTNKVVAEMDLGEDKVRYYYDGHKVFDELIDEATGEIIENKERFNYNESKSANKALSDEEMASWVLEQGFESQQIDLEEAEKELQIENFRTQIQRDKSQRKFESKGNRIFKKDKEQKNKKMKVRKKDEPKRKKDKGKWIPRF